MPENVLGRIINILFYSIMPKKWHDGLKKRFAESRRMLTSTKELRALWILCRILLFPIIAVVSLVIVLIKLILFWISPSTYNNQKYIIKQMYLDVVRDKFGIKNAIKRAELTNELFVKGAEKQVSYGEKNPDKTFYVIRPYYFLEPNALVFRNIANLLTQYYYALQKLTRAVDNNWIPVVDWQNYGRMPHSEDEPVNGTTNSWEYYWEQPSEYTLDEVYSSKNVILSTQNIGQYGFIPAAAMRPPFEEYADNLTSKCPNYTGYFQFNEKTQSYIDKWYEELFPANEPVLGVVVRGASYGRVGTPMQSHPKQVKMDELIRSVRQYCAEWGYEYIFFVNEMEELVDLMKNEFGDKLIVLPRLRDHLDRPADGVTQNPLYAPGQKYKTNLDYITEVALLSRCDSLIGSMSSGMRSAIMWNAGKYRHRKIFENGLW